VLFKCFIKGENFPGQLLRRRGLYGFYATRFVEADTAEEAELLGLEALRQEQGLQIKSDKLRKQQPPAKVYFEKIEAVAKDTPRVPNSGATWFEME